nr:hypothetical protein JUJ52_17720 [Virgibacillus sp. AGTR]
MSEETWLTAGEMMNSLKVREIAISKESNIKITKALNGNLEYVDYPQGIVAMEPKILNALWRIEPNYVSFDEAMSARKNDGKQVYFIDPADGSQLELKGTDPLSYFGRFSWEELFNGNWLINYSM